MPAISISNLNNFSVEWWEKDFDNISGGLFPELKKEAKGKDWPLLTHNYSKPAVINDYHSEFVNQIENQFGENHPEVVVELESPELWPNQPITEKLTPEQKAILERYNNLHMNLLPDNWQEVHVNLLKRPDITQEQYQLLLDNQEKHTDYDTIKGDLGKWTSTFPDFNSETLDNYVKRLESDKTSLQNQVNQLASNSSPDKQLYLSIQKENDWLWETVELLNKGWLQNKLWLDSIEDEKETNEAIVDLLEDTILYWRSYLESTDKEIFYKMPVLGSRFVIAENRTKAINLITWMILVLEKKKTLDELLVEWHGGKTWIDYNKTYDFDNSLWAFTQLLYLKKKYQAINEPKSKEVVNQGNQTLLTEKVAEVKKD